MQFATHWRPQLITGAGEALAARQRTTVLPCDLRTEWGLVIRARSNLLLVGSSPATDAMLVALKPYLREPLLQHKQTAGASAPQPVEGTLVLLEVAGLDAKQQAELLRWLNQFDGREQLQVVSTTSQPLFALVESGAFLPDLYYRLNIVRMDLTSSDESP